MSARLLVALVCLAVLGLVPAAANAADPGRWIHTGHSTIPLYYYQGMTSDPARNLYFDGIHSGLYRTDAELRETARNDDAIPPTVRLGEGYNHIGDITWDDAEGGRVLLPVECYYPGQGDNGNTCRTGSIGVADPVTLQWRYYVKLDPADIPKAMWSEVSPDGQLLWTSSGNDLLAYRVADVNPGNAAPSGALLKPVRRLAGAVPPSGITGAIFHRGRLFVAGQNEENFKVYSIDLATGSHRLEIERDIVGESEGLDVIDTLGGTLHWMIMPYNNEGPPTYGPNNGALLHFVEAGSGSGRVRVSLSPRRTRAGRRTRFRVRATRFAGGRWVPLAGATVRIGGRRARTASNGRATIVKTFRRRGLYSARASRGSLRTGFARIRVLRARR